MGQGLEGINVQLGRLELLQGERCSLCHDSKTIKLWNQCQEG
jgi:hypothetical protein